MVGISQGSRKFVMQKALFDWKSKVTDGGAPITYFNEGANSGEWNLYPLATNPSDNCPALVYNITKMDLRAFNQGGKGLALSNIGVQESIPVYQNTMAPVSVDGQLQEKYDPAPLVVYDILTTEKPNLNAIYEIVFGTGTPGFLKFVSGFQDGALVDEEDSTDYNPSMVVYGLWRYYQVNEGRLEALRVFQSSEFGTGETIVAPHVYWTRCAYIPDIRANAENQMPPFPDKKNFLTLPAANLFMAGAVVDLSTGEELAQMARSAMR